VLTMGDGFYQVLGLSALADYFNTTYLRGNGRGHGLNFLCMKSIAPQLANIFEGLGARVQGWDYTEDARYCWLEFQTEDDKDKVDDYFSQFNANNRKLALIAMPDLYEGKEKANPELCDWYLAAIEEFIAGDLRSPLAIPMGVSDSDATVRMFMVYKSEGMVGLYPGPQIFKNSPIRFVD
jgi:hypothetical protein